MGPSAEMARQARWIPVLLCLASSASAQIIFGGGPVVTPAPTRPPAAVTSDLGSLCRTPAGRRGLCDQLQHCPSLMLRLNRRDIEHLKQSVCGKHDKQTLLCCPDNLKPTPTPPPPPTLTPAPPPPPPPTPTPTPTPECGLTHVAPPRLVGGEPVQAPGDFPWMVALRYSSEPEFKCGGSVLNSRWVLTAAHCIVQDGPIGARIGDLNLATPIDDDYLHPPQNIEVEKVFGHPGFKRGFKSPNKGLVNDIALIKLKKDIEFSDVVRPICLPSSDASDQLEGSAGIAGWGLTEFGGVGAAHMQQAFINFTNMETCKSHYGLVGVWVDPRQHTCASGNVTDRTLPGCSPGDTRIECQGGVDACEGDSGGPLMTFEKLEGISKVTVAGIVSFAVGCGNAMFPGIYTRVDSYLDWLEDTIAKNSF